MCKNCHELLDDFAAGQHCSCICMHAHFKLKYAVWVCVCTLGGAGFVAYGYDIQLDSAAINTLSNAGFLGAVRMVLEATPLDGVNNELVAALALSFSNGAYRC